MATASLFIATTMLVLFGSKLGKSPNCAVRIEVLIEICHPVKIRPGKNYLPQALRVLIVAARNGFDLDHAKQGWQQQSRGVTVVWDDNFVEELKTGLHACRVMCVPILFTFSLSTRSH
jgi:POT family proton-dependent oligopeptide transporter